MGSDVNKIYNKAMNYYQRGELDKAINKCEQGISISLKSANLLNLKGLLLYLKGDLNGAVAVWKINRDYNSNKISKVYIKDSKRDEEKLKLYELADQDIKNLRIEDALLKLNKCAESDFNSINVNISFAICYLRKGDYILAKEYNEKALKINIKDKVAIEVRDQIESFQESPTNRFKSNIIKVTASLLALMIIVTVVLIYTNRDSRKVILEDKVAQQKQEDIDEELKDVPKNNIEVLDNEEESNNKLEEPIEKEADKKESVEQLLSNEQVKNEYIKGSDSFNAKDYSKAIEVLSKAYKNSEEMYLKDDILFFLASSYDKSNLKTDSIKYYEEYVERYNNENYIKEVYYNLALNYKDEDINKSKEYAKILEKEYSDSIYYNSKIKKIISS